MRAPSILKQKLRILSKSTLLNLFFSTALRKVTYKIIWNYNTFLSDKLSTSIGSYNFGPYLSICIWSLMTLQICLNTPIAMCTTCILLFYYRYNGGKQAPDLIFTQFSGFPLINRVPVRSWKYILKFLQEVEQIFRFQKC